MGIGNILKLLRESRNISQSKLARETQISQNFLSMIESGSRVPKPDCVSSIMSYCNEKESLTAIERAKIIEAIIGYMLPGSQIKIEDLSGSIHLDVDNILIDTGMIKTTKVMRHDVQVILKAILNSSNIRDTFLYLINNDIDLESFLKLHKTVEKVRSLSDKRISFMNKIASLMPALNEDKLPVILTVVTALIQSGD